MPIPREGDIDGEPVQTLAIIGLGYVGLPLAARAVECGLDVYGVDSAERVIDGLLAGNSHVDDIDDDDVARMLVRGFRPVHATDPLPRADAYVICVPTPLSGDGGPDLAAIRAAGRSIATALAPGALVVLESTSYPGTTESVLRPILESSGLRAGSDFHLAFSPERIDPGRASHPFSRVPKVVGGLTPACRDAAVDLYARLVDTVVTTRSLREAEMAKLIENTYRHVNIALVNELARFCDLLDIDIWDAISAAESKPFGFQRFDPGPGVGGHCIPIDPNYLSHYVEAETGQQFRFVHLAQEINAGMPAYVAARIERMLSEGNRTLAGARVLLIGITYKADVADARETPAMPLADVLVDGGASVLIHDPLLPEWSAGDTPTTPVPDLGEALAQCDVAVLLQAHSCLDIDLIAREAPLLLDTRGRIARETPRIERL